MTTTNTDDYVYLVMTANGWAAGSVLETVRNQLISEWGRSHIKKYGTVVYRVHPDFEISEIDGTIYTPKGSPPIKIEDNTRVEGVSTKGVKRHG